MNFYSPEPSIGQSVAARYLGSMLRSLGVVLGVGALGAGYQIAHEEGREVVVNWRKRQDHRRYRNDFINLRIAASDLPAETKMDFRRARDAYDLGIRILADTRIREDYARTIRDALEAALDQ